MSEPTPDTPPHHDTRLQLMVDVVVFQFKLAADGLRDLLLIPASIVAAIVGLVAGGNEPDLYFRRVLHFGHRSERWINLFGTRRRDSGADALVRPLEESVLARVRSGGRLGEGARHVNQMLDAVNRKHQAPARPADDDPPRSS
jgi:hypothetical protein